MAGSTPDPASLRARLAPFGVAVLLAALAVAIFAPAISPYDPL
jgi:hypothetical protein